MDESQGCPGCNPDRIPALLDAEGLVALEVTADCTEEDAIDCECGRKWVIVPLAELVQPLTVGFSGCWDANANPLDGVPIRDGDCPDERVSRG
jgi:hypothetical protein